MYACICCRTVERACFWRSGAPEPQKRPILLAVSALLVAAMGALIWRQQGFESLTVLLVVEVPLLLFGLAGLFTVKFGCDACVAKLLGR